MRANTNGDRLGSLNRTPEGERKQRASFAEERMRLAAREREAIFAKILLPGNDREREALLAIQSNKTFGLPGDDPAPQTR